MPQPRDDPYLNFNFRVEIDGSPVAGFSEVVLPEGRIESVAYREGTDKVSNARLLPGRVEYGPIVLRKGDDLLQLAEDAIRRGADVIGMAGGDGSQALVATVAVRHGVPHVVVPPGDVPVLVGGAEVPVHEAESLPLTRLHYLG